MADIIGGRRPYRRWKVSGERWLMDPSANGAVIKGYDFHGSPDLLPAVYIAADSSGRVPTNLVFEDCDFFDCFRSVEIAASQNARFVRCRVINSAPSSTKQQFGFYLNGAIDTLFEGCYVENSWLDRYKLAGSCQKTTFRDCWAVGPSSGAMAPEAGGWDVAYGGDRLIMSGCRSINNNGVGLTIKTHVDFPYTVGDCQISDYYSESDVYGITHEAVDSIDYPTPPSNPGVRPEAMRIHISNPIIKSAVIGMFLNGQDCSITGGQVSDCEQEGLILYRSLRNLQIAGLTVRHCAVNFGTTKPLVTIKGAQGVSWVSGLVDGIDKPGGTVKGRACIEVFDRDASNKAESLRFGIGLQLGQVTGTGSPRIGFFCDPVEAICDLAGNFDPTVAGAPNGGCMGGRGSSFRDTRTGICWDKQDQASSRAGWKQRLYAP